MLTNNYRVYCPMIGANEKLNKKPRTVDEIGDAKKTWKEIDNKVCFVFFMCIGIFMFVSATIFLFCLARCKHEACV